MPTYEFRCTNGHEFEQFHRRISDAPSTVECPTCGVSAERRISGGAGLMFKGSGFYLTDYGKNAHRKGAPTGGDKGGESGGGKADGAATGDGGSSGAASGAASGGGTSSGSGSSSGASGGGSGAGGTSTGGSSPSAKSE